MFSRTVNDNPPTYTDVRLSSDGNKIFVTAGYNPASFYSYSYIVNRMSGEPLATAEYVYDGNGTWLIVSQQGVVFAQ